MYELIFGNLILFVCSVVVASIFGLCAAVAVWCVLSTGGEDRRILYHVFLLLPVFLAALALVLFSANIPYDDDFNSIVAYLSYPWPQRLCHLLDCNWEHRIGLTNLCSEVMVAMTGRVNFQWLEVVGLSFVAGIAYMFLQRFRYYGKVGYFAAAAFFWLLLSVVSDYFFWPMASIQNNGVLFLAFLSIAMWRKAMSEQHDWATAVTLVLAVACTFTSGSGMLVWPTLMLMTFVRRDYRKSIIRTTLLVTLAIVSALGYFHGPLISQDMSREAFSLVRSVVYFFTFVGAWTCVPGVAVVAGVVSCCILAWLAPRMNRIKNLEVYFFALYILAVMATGAIFRSERIVNALPPRHPELSFSILGCVMILVFEQLGSHNRIKRIGVSILCGYAVYVNIFAFGFFGSIWRDRLEIDRLNLMIRPLAIENLTSIHGPWQHNAINNLRILEERGIYDSLWNLKKDESPPHVRIDPGDFWTPGRRVLKCDMTRP